MDEIIFFDTLRQALWASVIVSLPILLTALVVGVAIGLVQALTSVQEMTLTFVPKLGAMLIVFWAVMGFMSDTLNDFFRVEILPMIEVI